MFIAKKVILVMLSVFAFIACSPNTHDVEKTIKIGVMLSLTGDAAQVSNDIKNAILIMNEKYANKNIKTQLIIEDTSGDTKKILSVANKLIYIDKVDVIITTISSNAVLVSPLAHKEGILHFGIVDNANKKVNTTTFTHWTTPEQKAQKLVELLKKDNAKNVAIIIQNIETQKTLSLAVEKEIRKYDLNSHTYYFNSNNLDFRTDLLKIKNKNYDKIVLLMFSPMIDIVARQIDELNIETPLTAIASFIYSQNKSRFEGIPFINSYTSNDTDILDVKNKVNALSTHALPQFWDIFEIVSDVVNKFYSNHSRKPNGREMTDIILKMREYDGKTGHLDIGADRTIQSQASVIMIKNGIVTVVD